MLPAALRRWLARPKKSDQRLLAKFFHIDEELSEVVHNLSLLDVQQTPHSYTALVNRLNLSQERMLDILEQILQQCIPTKRRRRDYHVKFPDDQVTNAMTTHLLFSAELLLGGIYIEVEELDGVLLQPLAHELLQSLTCLRQVLRAQSLEDPGRYPESTHQAMLHYDNLCAEFELRYMSLVVNVKSPEAIFKQQEVAVLFCETVSRALQRGCITQEMIDDCDPELMISIPRLAVISGLLIFPDGPLNVEKPPEEMCDLFNMYHDLLKRIRELLYLLSEDEVFSLERALCSSSEDPPASLSSSVPTSVASSSSDCSQSTQNTSQTNFPHNPTGACDGTVSGTYYPCDQQGIVPVDSEHMGSQDVNLQSDPRQSSEILRNVHVPCTIRTSTLIAVRSRYRSNSDIFHRLFICVAGVADQLQTNHAGDLRSILKTVFEVARSRQQVDTPRVPENASRLEDCHACQKEQDGGANAEPPKWIPDSACTQCMYCSAPFSLFRRRHHCRSCGKIVCSKCSGYTASLPHYPQAVRVCLHCYRVHCRPRYRQQED
ncbi:lateral signaling target protein 2 homolog [Eleutherodactylus coqui]|uniref:lateral signaling target protein 2 homolog n=1 Tax=Eleutherodactylus coqui TaxID=57060 RepID=UPI0034619ABB